LDYWKILPIFKCVHKIANRDSFVFASIGTIQVPLDFRDKIANRDSFVFASIGTIQVPLDFRGV